MEARRQCRDDVVDTGALGLIITAECGGGQNLWEIKFTVVRPRHRRRTPATHWLISTQANTGAHHGGATHAVQVLAGKLANGTGATTFLFRGIYRPVYGCRETYLAGPSTPEKIEAVEEAVASRDVDPQNRGSPEYVAVHDTYRWHQFLDFEATVEEELLRKVPGATLYDVGPLVTARTDLHARDCLHFHALPGSRARGLQVVDPDAPGLCHGDASPGRAARELFERAQEPEHWASTRGVRRCASGRRRATGSGGCGEYD